jgi:hypothetical protein
MSWQYRMTQYEPAFLTEMFKQSIQKGKTPSLMVISNKMSSLLHSGVQAGLMGDYASQS